jgi:ubiquinone/menaquinone biosynthesis C-methylase UbiE/uncharacterized protein YbaR (Trm112 family)
VKKDLLKYLACPMCKLDVIQICDYEEKDGEIFEGSINCTACSREYPIKNGIPYLYSDTVRNIFNKTNNKERNTGRNSKRNEITEANIVFHDEIADSYNDYMESSLGNNSKLRIIEILKYIKQRCNGEFLLDIGTGTGNVIDIAKNEFVNTFGIDVSIKMLEISRMRGFQVGIADAYNMPFKDESVDAISCFSVTHHLYKLEIFFREANRVLKDGGFFYSDWDPNTESKNLMNCYNDRMFSSKTINPIKMGYRVFHRLTKERNRGKWKRYNNEYTEIREMAEYYHHHGDKKGSLGLSPYKLTKILESSGFNHIKIFKHWNSKSIFKSIFKSYTNLQLLNIFMRNILVTHSIKHFTAPYFLIIARK